MTATYKNLRVTSTYQGDKVAPWDDKQQNYNNHVITVTNTENGAVTRFDFWGSIANPELTKEYDVLNALYCFVSDAVSGKENFENFCAEFGYDTDSRTAERTWKACKKSLEKLQRIYSGDIYDLANELSEVAG